MCHTATPNLLKEHRRSYYYPADGSLQATPQPLAACAAGAAAAAQLAVGS